MTNILFVGSHPLARLIKEKNIDSLYRCSETIIAGLKARNDVSLTVVTSPDIASFPNNDIFFSSFTDDDGALMVSSLNLPVIKQLWTILSMTIASIRILRRYNGNVIVIIPYMVFRHVVVSRLLKFFFPSKVKTCIIIPDVFFPSSFIQKLVNRWTEKHAVKSDYFVLYTKAMSDYLCINTRPQVVIEGFCDIPISPNLKRESKSKIITYAGSLNVKYGILRLLDAFSKLETLDASLHLYGAGDAEILIHEYEKKDSRIKFLGRIPKDKVSEILKESDILVNPRGPQDGEYVEYSFPSKDIEYMGTGKPCVFCRLPGMPIDYYPFFINAGDGTVDQLYEALLTCINMSQAERNALGYSAHAFIAQRMDINNQVQRIMSLFK